jgi:hypothetical protein
MPWRTDLGRNVSSVNRNSFASQHQRVRVCFRCPNCERMVRASGERAGKAGRCGLCRARVEVPALERPARPDHRDVVIVFDCTSCEHEIKTPRCYAGRRGRCPACEAKIKVPGSREPSQVASPLTEPPSRPSRVAPSSPQPSIEYDESEMLFDSQADERSEATSLEDLSEATPPPHGLGPARGWDTQGGATQTRIPTPRAFRAAPPRRSDPFADDEDSLFGQSDHPLRRKRSSRQRSQEASEPVRIPLDATTSYQG